MTLQSSLLRLALAENHEEEGHGMVVSLVIVARDAVYQQDIEAIKRYSVDKGHVLRGGAGAKGQRRRRDGGPVPRGGFDWRQSRTLGGSPSVGDVRLGERGCAEGRVQQRCCRQARVGRVAFGARVIGALLGALVEAWSAEEVAARREPRRTAA